MASDLKTTSPSQSHDVATIRLQKEGRLDLWFPPMALIGCVIVVGPVLALTLQNLPRELLEGQQLLIGTGLTVSSAIVLLVSFALARRVVSWSDKCLRVDAEEVGIYGPKAVKAHAQSRREEVTVQRRNYVIRAQSGTYVSPVIHVALPGHAVLTMTVDDSGIQWDQEVQECEEEATYTVSEDDWKRLVIAFGLDGEQS